MNKNITKRMLLVLFVGIFLFSFGCSNTSDEGQNHSTDSSEKNTTDSAHPATTEKSVLPEASTIQLSPKTTEQTTTEKAPEKKSNSKEGVEISDLAEELEKTISANGFDKSNVSVFVKDLKSNNYVNMDCGSLRAASLIKLFVAGTVYEQIENGSLKSSYDGEITGLMEKMITVSDNDACNTLVKKLGGGDASAGMNKVNSYCNAHGFQATSMGRLMLDFSSGKDNYTSVSDCAKFLRLIVSKDLAGSEEILSFMKQQTRTSKIPAGVPSGVETANKTGELDDTENDVAIIYKNSKPYILCVMVTPTSNVAAARTLITDISKTVYENME
ncbi:MAG: class A beta-lactamase-related serine hydrolase [Lachnospiraceae bacterium]|nr:class A beta-lactamase-related serine hydrolase [Lachnospiraceae bacterium]